MFSQENSSIIGFDSLILVNKTNAHTIYFEALVVLDIFYLNSDFDML